eukprot:CAMPEP_0178646096 /NCGR_PEP_ID=MMETSP0698-20121128/19191_1 /TAXON_ID=265572 /ORGANISM="Extubocellulus spinifer, Strain CCMP396" /LENGTH=371 /DNA_ID=CAMNT_0020287227 /DNA_START=166 /DNA_END=1281 /DNA_ORIENTATION=+
MVPPPPGKRQSRRLGVSPSTTSSGNIGNIACRERHYHSGIRQASSSRLTTTSRLISPSILSEVPSRQSNSSSKKRAAPAAEESLSATRLPARIVEKCRAQLMERCTEYDLDRLSPLMMSMVEQDVLRVIDCFVKKDPSSIRNSGAYFRQMLSKAKEEREQAEKVAAKKVANESSSSSSSLRKSNIPDLQQQQDDARLLDEHNVSLAVSLYLRIVVLMESFIHDGDTTYICDDDDYDKFRSAYVAVMGYPTPIKSAEDLPTSLSTDTRAFCAGVISGSMEPIPCDMIGSAIAITEEKRLLPQNPSLHMYFQQHTNETERLLLEGFDGDDDAADRFAALQFGDSNCFDEEVAIEDIDDIHIDDLSIDIASTDR